MGDAFSLEQRLQLGESAAGQERLEATLLNLVLPLLLLVGSGRKVSVSITSIYSFIHLHRRVLRSYSFIQLFIVIYSFIHRHKTD